MSAPITDTDFPVPVSRAAERAARRAAGGKRRADCATDAPVTSKAADLSVQEGSGGRRARRGDPYADLDEAVDAARTISIEARTWDALSVLAHSEIAVLAVEEARDALAVEVAAARRIWWPRQRRRILNELALRRTALDLAVRGLEEAHDQNLVEGD